MLVAGAAWTATADTPQDIGRQPLAVETPTATHAADLIPAVITTTPHARYLSLHARAALEGQRLGWSNSNDTALFRGLVRRAEVVLSAISVQHVETNEAEHLRRGGPTIAHGAYRVRRWLSDHGELDVAAAAEDYSASADGFFSTYSGIGTTLGLLRRGDVPAPGPAADETELSVLDDIVRLAVQPRRLSPADLGNLAGLCLCRVAQSTDGACLRRAFFGPRSDDVTVPAVHRLSAAVLRTALIGHPTDTNVDLLMDQLCCYTADLGPVLPNDDVRQHALRWRGALLRNWSVWAWRMLWARLVSPLATPGTRADAIDPFVAHLPNISVQHWLADQLPPLTTAPGALAPAEHLLHDAVGDTWPVPELLLLLAIGAYRADGLDDISRTTFLNHDQPGWGPTWFRHRLERNRSLPLPDFAMGLAQDMFTRADVISRQKMQWTRHGLRLPTRLRTIGDRLVLEGTEGHGPASLRLNTFTNMLHQLGIVAPSEDVATWVRGTHQIPVIE
jgi:hypothetical protein